jgi:hypothetical protein
MLFNSTLSTQFIALSQHIEPPGIVVYSSGMCAVMANCRNMKVVWVALVCFKCWNQFIVSRALPGLLSLFFLPAIVKDIFPLSHVHAHTTSCEFSDIPWWFTVYWLLISSFLTFLSVTVDI